MTVGGGVLAFEQVGDQVESDLQRAEMLAAPILFLFSLLVFRSVVAALLPLAVGMTTILITFSLLRLVNAFEPMSTFAINLITGLGLGLAIDYSLFMVSRFREELATGAETLRRAARHDAHRRAHGAVLRLHGRGGAGGDARVPAALPVLDGRRRRAGRADRGAPSR